MSVFAISKWYQYAFFTIFIVWQVYSASRGPAQPLTVSVAIVFFLLYLAPATIFGAQIKVTSTGVAVRQYTQKLILFPEVKGCYSLYLFPWQLVILVTTHAFPSNIVIAEDLMDSPRKSVLQEGALARQINAQLAPLHN